MNSKTNLFIAVAFVLAFGTFIVVKYKEVPDAKKRKALKENPELLRQEMRDKETNIVFGDWLNQLNSNLKVTFVSDTFKKRMGAAPAQ